MSKISYLNRQSIGEGDVKRAFDFAVGLADCVLTTNITLLVETQMQFPLLKEVGLNNKHFVNHGVRTQKHNIRIHSVKSYTVNYNSKEVLVAIGVSNKSLLKYEDNPYIECMVVVPQSMDEVCDFLRVHEAIDIETGKQIKASYQIDKRIINAVGWLRDVTNVSSDITHPNDRELLHEMANALAHYSVPFDYYSVVYAASQVGLEYKTGRIIAYAFMSAKRRRFPIRECEKPYFEAMREIMNRERK